MTDSDLERDALLIRWRPWVAFSHRLVNAALMWPLAAVLVVSAVAGYILWYGSSILAAPWYLWPFVPDSPLAVTFMGAALVAFHYGRHWELLGLLASGACIKYGLWTDFVWLANDLSGGAYGMVAILMSLTHFAMVILGLALVVFLRFRALPVLAASLFLIVNDVVDYVLGYYPPLPDPQDLGAIARFAAGTTAVIVCSWIVVTWMSSRRVAAHMVAGKEDCA